MTPAKQVLIVDDDDDLRTSVAEQMELHEGFMMRQAADGEEALQLLGENEFELILLDVGLPDTAGRQLCRLIRRKGVKTPVIMLTAHASDADVVLGLESGANDYVTKPFRLSVLLARARAQRRQFELSDYVSFEIGPYSFKPSAKMLVNLQSGRRLHLTEKETSLQIPVPSRQGGSARGAAGRGLGIPQQRDDPHPRNARLPPSPEDRAGSRRPADPRHGAAWIPARSLAPTCRHRPGRASCPVSPGSDRV